MTTTDSTQNAFTKLESSIVQLLSSASWQTNNDAIAQLQKVGQRLEGAAQQIIDALQPSHSLADFECQLVPCQSMPFR